MSKEPNAVSKVIISRPWIMVILFVIAVVAIVYFGSAGD